MIKFKKEAIVTVERSGGKMDINTTKSLEGSPVECRKSRKSNPVVRTVEGSPMEHSKSQESNRMVRTVSYADTFRRNILPS